MSNKQEMVSTASFGDLSRTVVIEIDRQYIVRPLNPRATKNRDRECVLLALVPPDKPEVPTSDLGQVRFLDTNRKAQVQLRDLVPAGELYTNESLED